MPISCGEGLRFASDPTLHLADVMHILFFLINRNARDKGPVEYVDG
jgi:hypothetical protein